MDSVKATGKFVISLDFELFWGVHDTRTLDNYGQNVLGARQAIPKILALFEKYEIHATWAVVGYLFCKNKAELQSRIPIDKPKYDNKHISTYEYLASVGEDENDDPYHYALSIINLIKKKSNQEIGSHTFSHYYGLEAGQNIQAFEGDIKTAVAIAADNGVKIESLVFPRNQINQDYLLICKKYGIKAVRGNEKSWLYAPISWQDESLLRRGLRLLDSYINITGYNTYEINKQVADGVVNVASSRFLRPYLNKLAPLEFLKIRRILKSLEYAAKNNQVYHLWWHPHNCGVDTDKNLATLEIILQFYKTMNNKYQMLSYNMAEAADLN